MATVTRENIGTLNDKIIVKVAKEDYLPSFEKALKSYGKKASIPGFRKGMVPTNVIKKMYGSAVFTDEVLRSVEKELTSFMENEKLEIFAQPLPLPENDSSRIDMSKPEEYAFAFEVGLKPDFSLPDLPSLHPTYYKIEVTDKMIDDEVDRLRSRHGIMSEPETVTGDDNILNVVFTETDAEGNAVENGITKDNTLRPTYFTEAKRPQLNGLKKDDSIVVQLKDAFETKELEWIVDDLGLKDDPAAGDKYFRITISKVGLLEKANFDDAFFKAAFPEKEITSEQELREEIRKELQQYLDQQSRSQLQHTLYHELINNTQIDFPESFLKRWLQQGEKTKTQEEAEAEYPSFVTQLKWTLIVDKIIRENNIEVTADDIRGFARQQLMGYMRGQVADTNQPWIDDYVNRMMQDRKFVEETIHRLQADKVLAWTETQIGSVETPISLEEFNRLQEEHQHHHH